MSTVPIDEEHHHRRERRGEAPTRGGDGKPRQRAGASGRIRGGWLVQGDAGNQRHPKIREGEGQPIGQVE